MKILYLFVFLLFAISVQAQPLPARAFDNVTLHHADGTVISNAAIVWRGNKIEAAGRDIEIPFDARVYDGGDTLHVYPGFIDGMALWGSPDLPSFDNRGDHPGEPTYERAGIRPDRVPERVLEESEDFVAARNAGFKTAAIGLKGFMLPGQIDIFTIRDENTANHLQRRGVGQLSQFETSPGVYPSTLMGVMTHFRQLWHNAVNLMEHQNLYASNAAEYSFPGHDPVLEAFYPLINGEKPVFFAADEKEDIERVLRLKDELGFDLILVSGREAYRAAGELARRDIPVLASIELPELPDWMEEENNGEELSEEEEHFRQRQQESYENRVRNILSLLEAGVRVGYASNGMETKDFRTNIKTLMKYGLSGEQLMAILTRNTAEILGIDADNGGLEPGKLAGFSVFSTELDEIEDEEGWTLKYSVSGGHLLSR